MKNGKNVESKVVVNFQQIEVRNGNFVFGFTIEEKNVSYECIYKKDLKGIAAEKWTIDGKITKVGISKGCKILGLSKEIEEEILKKRLIILRNVRGDESNKGKIEFEIVELKSKLESYENKIESVKKKIEEKEKELIDCVDEENNEKIDMKSLVMKSKEDEIKRLKMELEKLGVVE